uniref:Reverse transcriptase domain-containing protein n=1 Tax=Tanacetum cinerariifolium TaxID=118510 RepID=A0A6L2MCT7_TANCI|nr:hypothetical protein [Tanacetum cinerariifolium]
MAETMQQYMNKTQAKYGSGIARPKIEVKELRDNTFSGSDQEDENEHIEKVLEIVNLFHIPNITEDRVMLRTFLASVSLMPLSTYLNLGLGELAHIKLTVELADMTVKYPKGIAENVLVGIGKFVFPVDFINLDMPEDVKVPLILKTPFLSTAHAKIDVFKRNITLRVGD